jgi:ribonuclease HI
MTRKEQMFILSLDTARAFDSISHKFIKKLLRHIQLPEWTVLLVDGLLHHVTVRAMIAGDEATPIKITRGVKQGCPFSPLLFIICFDVLLWHLEKKKGLSAYGYADDLALASQRVWRLEEALDTIRAFSKASGLGLNAKKTVIVGTRKLRTRERLGLDIKGLGQIKQAPSCTYLGVVIGPGVRTEKVFAAAMKKFNKRLESYRPLMRVSSMHTRIVIANVFLLPLLYYLAQFYIAHYGLVVVPARQALHQAIVSFHGTSIAYAHLLLPRSKGGPFTPLKDFWCTNLAMLAANTELEANEGLPIPAMGVKGHEHWALTQAKGDAMTKCMVPSGHAAHAGFTYMNYFCDRGAGHCINLEGLPGRKKGAARRRFIYQHMADRAYEYGRGNPAAKTSLHTKLGRFTQEPRRAANFVANAKAAAPDVTPAVWNTQVRLIHNALPFERRRRGAEMHIADRMREIEEGTAAEVGEHDACYFCGDGPDSAEHVYGECRVVRTARKSWGEKLGCNWTNTMDSAMMTFRPVANKAYASGIVCFNWAVWSERSEYLPTLGWVPKMDSEVNRIILRAGCRMPVEGGTSGGKAAAAVEKFARNPPASALVIFTDGSALDNPGPCGGGLVTRLPGETEYAETVIPLGQGDNNKGEMGGLKGAACAVEDALEQGRIKEGSEVFVFSDSALCIGHVDRGWRFPKWKKLAHAVTKKIRKLRKKVKLTLHWVRGHAGIPGNEMADKAAGKASKIAKEEKEERVAQSGKLPGRESKAAKEDKARRRYSG